MNDIYVGQLFSDSYLEHHGILGMKWGVRRFQNKDGSLTSAGKKRKDSLKGTAHRALAKVYELNERAYNKLGNKTLASMNKAAKNQQLKKAQEADESPKKVSNKKLAKDVGKIYEEESKKAYVQNIDKLEKNYTSKKYFDVVDSINKTAAKNATARITEKYGKLSSQQEAYLSASKKGSAYMRDLGLLREDSKKKK